jgi:uncharacterized membrane protein
MKHTQTPFQSSRHESFIPAGLILLSLVPVLAGSARLWQFISQAPIDADNARFFASPLPVVLHILSVSVYSLLGALQFAPGWRRSRPGWHRVAGRVLIPSGLVAALTGLWMSHFYPWPPLDGVILYAMRLVVGFAMTGFLLLGTFAIQQRNFALHADWMTRAYALGLGAGTQVFTHIPLLAVPDWRGVWSRAICMGAGWAINIAVAEWVIRNRAGRAHRRFPISRDDGQPLR